MGVLSALLRLPVSGPIGALTWIAAQIEAAARERMLDPARIEKALLLLERRLDDGEMSEAEFEAEETLLLDELANIRALRETEEQSRESEE